jgi:hypothetical protein
MNPVKSKRRVADHGEVFTPAWMVEAMLDLLKDEIKRIDHAITFAEWGYLGEGKFQRRSFRLDALTQSSALSAEGTLFAHLGKHEVFTPEKTYPPMTVGELAAGASA